MELRSGKKKCSFRCGEQSCRRKFFSNFSFVGCRMDFMGFFGGPENVLNCGAAVLEVGEACDGLNERY